MSIWSFVKWIFKSLCLFQFTVMPCFQRNLEGPLSNACLRHIRCETDEPQTQKLIDWYCLIIEELSEKQL